MLKILIVDDEVILRKGLSKAISRDKEFIVVGEAGDGVEALQLIEEHTPDVVITDIRMPNMDGKELVKNITQKYPDMKKVVLSGFEDFAYVRNTMKNGAVDYLLKPVDDEKLHDLLKEINELILMDKKRREEQIEHNIKLNESLPLLRDKYLQSVIRTKATEGSNEDTLNSLNYYGLDFSNDDRFRLILISIDNYRQFCSIHDEDEGKIKYFIIRNISEEIVEERAKFFSCQMDEGLAIYINTNNQDILDEVVDSIYYNLNKYAQVRFTIVSGSETGSIAEISTLYSNSSRALEQRFYTFTGTVFESNQSKAFQDWDSESETIKNDLEKNIESIIEKGNAGEVSKVFLDAFNKLKLMNTGPKDVKQLLNDIFLKMKFKFDDFRKAVDTLYTNGFNYIYELEVFDTADEIEKHSIKVYSELTKQIVFLRSKKDKRIIEIVKEYVSKHYNEDITLARITELVYVNANYFSEMFKNNTGENFIDYLTRYRIDKAKVLLKDVTIKTYEIGMMVGYEDPNYFSKVFKKVVGITPSQYRNIVL